MYDAIVLDCIWFCHSKQFIIAGTEDMTKEYKEFILEQLDLLDSITCKAMMGEFLLYYNNFLFDLSLISKRVNKLNKKLLNYQL